MEDILAEYTDQEEITIIIHLRDAGYPDEQIKEFLDTYIHPSMKEYY